MLIKTTTTTVIDESMNHSLLYNWGSGWTPAARDLKRQTTVPPPVTSTTGLIIRYHQIPSSSRWVSSRSSTMLGSVCQSSGAGGHAVYIPASSSHSTAESFEKIMRRRNVAFIYMRPVRRCCHKWNRGVTRHDYWCPLKSHQSASSFCSLFFADSISFYQVCV